MVGALIPLFAGKITDKLIEKSRDKLSGIDLKSKANDFLKRRIDKIPAFNEERKNLRKKQALEKQLKTTLEELKTYKSKGADYDTLSKHLAKVKELESQIDDLDYAINERINREQKIQEEISKRINSDIDQTFSESSKTPFPKEQKPKEPKLQSSKTTTKKIPKTKKSKSASLNSPQGPLIKNDFKSSSSLFNLPKEKKPRNIKNKLGRPKGAKGRTKDTLSIDPIASSAKSFGKPSFLESKGSMLSPTLNMSEENVSSSIKEIKLIDLLLINNNLQLEELEKLNKNIDTLSETMESNNSGNLLDLLKKPKGFLKTLIKSPIAKGIGLGAGVAAGVATIGYNVVSPQIDQRSLKKQLDEQLASGQITKDEYNKQLSFGKSKNDRKSKGASTGAAIGLGIGALTGPFAPVAMPLLAGAGSLAGNYLGGKQGEHKAMSDYLKTTAYLESGFNPNAKAGTSSASGMFQFTKGTWENMNKKHGLDYSLEDRFDPKKSAQVAALFAAENKQTIEKGTGQKANGTDLYMGHFLGAQGAVNFLNTKKNKGDKNAAEDPKFKAAAEANKSIFYNKDGTPKTFNQVYELMDKKYKKGQEKADELIAKHTPEILPIKPEEPKKPEDIKKPDEIKKPEDSIKPKEDVKPKEPELKTIKSTPGTIIEQDIPMSEAETKEFLKQQQLRRYKGTSYAEAMTPSIKDTGTIKSIDSQIVKYDKSKEQSETSKMQDSSKMISSEISKVVSNQPATQSIQSSPPQKVQSAPDDYISTSIRYYVNN